MTKSRGLRFRNRNLLNQTFGRWTVIDKAPRDKHGFVRWICRCVCGTVKGVNESTLVRGTSTSCGCLTLEVLSARGRHWDSKSRLYRCWRHLRSRCENKNVSEYKNYGGRGITVCERWQSYDNFKADMGEHPGPGYSIDRIDNDGNYEPSNCRWATRSQQSSNQQKKVCHICGVICKSGAGLSLHTRKMHAGGVYGNI